MESITDISSTAAPNTEIKLFTERAIGIATGLGGPLGGAYLISRNFRSLGKDDRARMAIIVGIVITVVVFGLVALLPEATVMKIPSHLVPLIFGITGYLIVKKYQQEEIEAHLAGGGKKGSGYVVFSASIVFLVVSLGVFSLVWFLRPESSPLFDGTPMKFETSGSTLFYDKATVHEIDAKNLGRLLEDMGYFNKEFQLPARFYREGNVYYIEMLVDVEKWDHSVVKHDIHQMLHILRDRSQNKGFRVVFVAVDSIGAKMRKTFIDDNS